mmetsp:Transcript_44464/g.110694  ORF Transcript_44464/g.110694 Transcript_44464/m.110694 type:complete len:97 (+) Transcript_44464:159-449(+)
MQCSLDVMLRGFDGMVLCTSEDVGLHFNDSVFCGTRILWRLKERGAGEKASCNTKGMVSPCSMCFLSTSERKTRKMRLRCDLSIMHSIVGAIKWHQ